MAKLTLSLDGMVIREYPLTKERTTIGRKPHNDIVIDNLAISGEHAMIMTILNDSFLEDLGSTNGTLVNGQPIKKHFLQNNDVVELGKYKLKYATEATAAQASPADFEKTMVLRAPPASAKPEPRPEASRIGETTTSVGKAFVDIVVNVHRLSEMFHVNTRRKKVNRAVLLAFCFEQTLPAREDKVGLRKQVPFAILQFGWSIFERGQLVHTVVDHCKRFQITAPSEHHRRVEPCNIISDLMRLNKLVDQPDNLTVKRAQFRRRRN